MSQLGCVVDNITAAGADLAAATQINQGTLFARTTAGLANTGVKLPSASPGTIIFVRNDGGNQINIYPSTANGQINALTAGVAIPLANGSVTRFIVSQSPAGISGIQYYSA